MMKKAPLFVLSLILCFAVAACQKTGDIAQETDDMYSAYSQALYNLIRDNKLPDGTDAPELTGDVSLNKFAISDIDGDGKDELILIWTNTYGAGQTGYVFAYDPEAKTLRTELTEFTCLTFYDNGMVKALWSHNQGRAGSDFWPYNLYKYVPETDSYGLVGMVDAWDKNYPGVDDQPFPSDIDKSGTGFVYYIMEDGQYDTSHPVDASEYNEWLNSYLEDAKEIEVRYMDLTEENVRTLTRS